MLERQDVRRPAQVNACFEGGSSRMNEIVSALRGVGLRENQITVIDRPDPEDTKVATEEPSFLDRIKSLFGGDKDNDAEHHNYDLLILAHLGQDEALADPVQEVFRRFDAARVNYYPPAEAAMHVLGGGDVTEGAELLVPVSEDADTDTTTHTPAGGGTAGAVMEGAGRRVEPGELGPHTVTQTVTTGGAAEHVEQSEEVVFRAETAPVEELASHQIPRTTPGIAVTTTTAAGGTGERVASAETGTVRVETEGVVQDRTTRPVDRGRSDTERG
jgi:hypothetical protein